MLTCLRQYTNKQEKYRAFTEKNNRKMESRFAAVPFSERIVFVPHCLRNTSVCKAKEIGSYYVCARCGGCAIDVISKKAKELGYKGVFILKGGRSMEKIIAEHQPKAILGVACYFEGAQGFEQTVQSGAAIQFVSLTKDGCVNTEVQIDEVLQKMSAAT
jgi:hypothetical protein